MSTPAQVPQVSWDDEQQVKWDDERPAVKAEASPNPGALAVSHKVGLTGAESEHELDALTSGRPLPKPTPQFPVQSKPQIPQADIDAAYKQIVSDSGQRRYTQNPAAQQFSAERAERTGPFLKRPITTNLSGTEQPASPRPVGTGLGSVIAEQYLNPVTAPALDQEHTATTADEDLRDAAIAEQRGDHEKARELQMAAEIKRHPYAQTAKSLFGIAPGGEGVGDIGAGVSEAASGNPAEGAARVVSGAGTLLTPTFAGATIEKPVEMGASILAGMGTSEAAGRAAEAAGAGPGVQHLAREVGFWAPLGAGYLKGRPYEALPNDPAARSRAVFRNLIYKAGGDLGEDFTPEEANAAYRRAMQNLRDPQNPANDLDLAKDLSAAHAEMRASAPLPKITSDEFGRGAPAAPAEISEAITVASKKAQAEQAAARVARGLPPVEPAPPPPPTPPPPMVNDGTVAAVGQAIQSLPKDQQPAAILEATQKAAESILHHGGAVVDGEVHTATTPQEALKVAKKVMDAQIAKADKVATSQNAPSTEVAKPETRTTLQKPAQNIPELFPSETSNLPVERTTPAQPSETSPQPPAGFEVERRTNLNFRDQVAAMSPEERADALLKMHTEQRTSKLTGLPNRVAFDEAQASQPAPAVAQSDADGLKALNDKFGYDAGNALLKAKAEALQEAGLEAYHEKGDEYLYRGKSQAELQSKLEKARSILRDRIFEATLANGEKVYFKGADFSHGTGSTLAEAESKLKVHKSEREARGERARGELRGITEVRPETGQEHPSAAKGRAPAQEIAATTQPETKPAKTETKQPERETKYKYGNTQAPIPHESEAGRALAAAREHIDKADLMPTGFGGDQTTGLETEPHVTVRYGIKGDDTAGIRKYIEQQAPFEATLGKTSKFPPSEHSDGAAPIIAPVEAPDLHRIEKELDQHGDFAERSFPEYKPHATVAYVKPDAADKYVGMDATEGKKFRVDRIAISDRNGNTQEVELKGKPAEAVKAPEGFEVEGADNGAENIQPSEGSQNEGKNPQVEPTSAATVGSPRNPIPLTDKYEGFKEDGKWKYRERGTLNGYLTALPKRDAALFRQFDDVAATPEGSPRRVEPSQGELDARGSGQRNPSIFDRDWERITSVKIVPPDNSKPFSISILDPTGEFSAERLSRSGFWRGYLNAINKAQGWLLKNLPVYAEVEKIGVFFPNAKMLQRLGSAELLGINIPNPDDQFQDGIFVNPLAHGRNMPFAYQHARDLWTSIIHELAHTVVRQHGEPFESAMAQMYALISPAAERRLTKELTEAISGGRSDERAKPSREYEAEVQRYFGTRRQGGGDLQSGVGATAHQQRPVNRTTVAGQLQRNEPSLRRGGKGLGPQLGSERGTTPLDALLSPVTVPLRLVRKANAAYDDFIRGAIDRKLQVGDKYWKVADKDPAIASLLHEVDNAPRYFREKATANLAGVTKGLSDNQIRLAAMMSDSDARSYLESAHPDEYAVAINDPDVMDAVARFKPLQKELSDWRESLGWPVRKNMYVEENREAKNPDQRWMVLDNDGNQVAAFKSPAKAADYVEANATIEDHLRRTYPEHMRQPLPAETEPGPYTGVFHEAGIRPPRMDKKQRLASAQYFYEHGAKDFSGYVESYRMAREALLKQGIYDTLTESATHWTAGTAQPPSIKYDGKTYYRPDIATKMREGGEKNVPTYQIYDPSRGERFLVKGMPGQDGEDGWSTLSTGKPGVGPNDRWLAPREVVDALENYDKSRGGQGAGSIRRFFQTQIVGLFGPAVHISNIVRRIGQTRGVGSFDPRSWGDITRLILSKDLRDRVLQGVDDETIDSLTKYGAYTDWHDIFNAKQYIGGNLNPLNWNKYGKGILFDPKFANGWGGLDPKARVLVHDYLKEHVPGITEEQIAAQVNDALGDYNRANWTDRQKMLSKFILFPGWDFASAKWFLRHPLIVGVLGSVAVLAANLALNRMGLNKDQDSTDLSSVHIGNRQYRPGAIVDSFGSHMAQPLLLPAQRALEGGDRSEVGAAVGEGVIRAGASLANVLRPDLQLALEEITNRRYLGGGKEIVSPEDAHTPGTVLPNRALEKRAVFAAVKAFPAINRFLDVEQKVDLASGIGSVFGVMNSKHGAEERLKTNASKAIGYAQTLQKLAEINPQEAEKFVDDPNKSVYLVFNSDLSQMVKDLKEIDADTSEVLRAKSLSGQERKQILANLKQAREQALKAADALNDALFAAKKNRTNNRPQPAKVTASGQQPDVVPSAEGEPIEQKPKPPDGFELEPQDQLTPEDLKPKQISKGDTVTLRDGSTGIVRYTHPHMAIARVESNGKVRTISLRDL